MRGSVRQQGIEPLLFCSDEFLIIGCDGLWDGLSRDDATQEIIEI